MSLSPRTQITSHAEVQARGDEVPSGSRRKRSRKNLKPAEEVQPPRKRTHRAAEKPEPKERRPRQYREPWEKRTLYIREVKKGGIGSGRFQLRVHVGSCKHREYPVNLGTYPSLGAAERARHHFLLVCNGRSVWEAIRELQRREIVPACVLPRWVYRRPGGGFAARVTQGDFAGTRIDGPFETPVEAYRAMKELLRRKFTRTRVDTRPPRPFGAEEPALVR